MRERLATIVMAVVIGGAVGAAGILFLSRAGRTEAQKVNGQPMSYWLKCLDSESEGLRAEATQVLPQFGNDAITPVIELLDEPRAQMQAADVLALIGPSAVGPLIESLKTGPTNKRLGAIKALERIGAPAAEATTPVVHFLKEEDVGPVAAEFVAKMGPNLEAVAVAVHVLETGSSMRQLDAIKVLSRASRSDIRAETALLHAARTGSSRVRVAAFEAVCKLNPPPLEAIPDMIAGLEHPETLVAARAGLAALGPAAIGPLRDCATHRSPRLRAEAVMALSQLTNHPTAAESLILFLKDPEPMVSNIAAASLESLRQRDLGMVVRQLKSPNAKVRAWAVREVGKIQPPMFDDLAPLLDDPDDEVRAEAADAIRDLWQVDDPMILESPKARDPDERIRGIRLLPFLRDTRKYDMMLAAMEDPHPQVRLAAARSLGRALTSGRAVQRLVEALKDDASSEVRAEAARALGRARDTGGVTAALQAASRDPDQYVAQAALSSLREPAAR